VIDTREPKAGLGIPFAPGETEQRRSRLAHWPPPFRNGQSQPKIVRHQPGENPKLAKSRGWRLTRAMLSDDG
jgi:hypothetical protein